MNFLRRLRMKDQAEDMKGRFALDEDVVTSDHREIAESAKQSVKETRPKFVHDPVAEMDREYRVVHATSERTSLQTHHFNPAERRRRPEWKPTHSDEDIYRRLMLLEQEVLELRNTLNDRDLQQEMAYDKIQQTVNENNQLKQALKRANEENCNLNEKLNESRTQVLSLRPYRKEYLPEEIGRDYDNLIDSVADWVRVFMAPFLEHDAAAVQHLENAIGTRSVHAVGMQQLLSVEAGYAWSSVWPEMEEDVLTAMIVQFLVETIFRSDLCGKIPQHTDTIAFLVTTMKEHMQPSRDPMSIRSWRAECFDAILQHPDFGEQRKQITEDLAKRLSEHFGLFCLDGKERDFAIGFGKNCIKPAFALHEKLLVSSDDFFFEYTAIIKWGENSDFNISPGFFESIMQFDCRDVLHSHKTFKLDEMVPIPSRSELKKNLLPVALLAPALSVRQLNRSDSTDKCRVVRKQRIVLAWGENDFVKVLKEFRKESDEPLLWRIRDM